MRSPSVLGKPAQEGSRRKEAPHHQMKKNKKTHGHKHTHFKAANTNYYSGQLFKYGKNIVLDQIYSKRFQLWTQMLK